MMNEQKENQASTALQTTTTGAVATVSSNKGFAAAVLQAIRADFIAVNEGLDMDFVYMAQWLVIDKKGIFVEKDGKDDKDTRVAYGDTIDVVIAQGEKRWTLWGMKDSPEDGQLIVAEREQVDAQAKLAQWLEENPMANERYDLGSPKLCYLAYVIPVAGLKETLAAGDMPKIYLMSFPPTATIAWGKYSYNGVYSGKYKALGIPARTGMSSVVTRIGTVEAEGGSKSDTYLALTFEPVGLFRPEDYGIDPTATFSVGGQAPAEGEKQL